MAVIAVADRNRVFTGRAPEPDSPVAVEVFLLDKGRISPFRCCNARAHRTANLEAVLPHRAILRGLFVQLYHREQTASSVTDITPPAASGHQHFPRRSENSTQLNAVVWTKRTAPGLRKKPRPRRASFVNDFFTDVGYFCGNARAVCVIFPPTNSADATRRRAGNIAVSTTRKMCACNTAQPFDLRPLSSCSRGLFRPPLKIPPAQGLCPLRTRHPARGGRASCPWAGAGTLAGA